MKLIFPIALFLLVASCLREGPIGPVGKGPESYPDGYFRIRSSGLYTTDGLPYSVSMDMTDSYSPLYQGYMERIDDSTLGFFFKRYQQAESGDATVSIYTDSTATSITGASLTVQFTHILSRSAKAHYQATGSLPILSATGDTLRFQRFVFDRAAHRIQGEFTLSRADTLTWIPKVLSCSFDCIARPRIQ